MSTPANDLTGPESGLTLEQELELNILAHDFSTESRHRAFQFILAAERLSVTEHLTDNPKRMLGTRKDSESLYRHTQEMAQLAREIHTQSTPKELELLTELAAHRGVTFGPKGRDSLGRTTRLIHTPKGRIPFD